MSQARFEVLEQLDQLEEIVLEGARVPFSGGRLVNEGDAVDVLDAVRQALPSEVERAAELLRQREAFLNQARQQAEVERSTIAARGEAQLDAERSQTLSALRQDVGGMAVDLAGRIVGESLSDDARSQAVVDRFIADLEAAPAEERN